MADRVKELEVSVFLRHKLGHNLISSQLGPYRPRERILEPLKRGLRLANGHFSHSSLLCVKFIELLHPHLIIIIPIRLLRCRLKGLYLIDRMVAVLINLVHCFDHSVQIAALHSQLFLKLEVHLLKNDPLPPHLINLLPYHLVLRHGITVALVRLVQPVLYYLSLLAQLRRAILIRPRSPAHRRTLLSFLLNYLPLQVLNFFIDSLARLGLPLDFLEQLLDLLFLHISRFLGGALLLDLAGHLHLLHLKLFEQLVVFNFKLAHFLILLSKLCL